MTEVTINPLVSPWVPESDPRRAKVLGKAVEESGEYTSALARCLIQGIDECEPVTKKPNKLWLEEEAADALATLRHVIETFGLDESFIAARFQKKYDQLQTWFVMPVNQPENLLRTEAN